MPKKTTTKKTTIKKAIKKTPVKKVVKKTPAKKAATKKKITKKSTTKKTANKPLVYANDEKAFWVKDGQILNSLVALNAAFDEMEKVVYEHHVTDERHDFADWVDSVLCDKKCATELKKANDPKKACTVVRKHLKFYKV